MQNGMYSKVILALASLVLLVSACEDYDREYYAEQEHYIDVTGVVSHIKYSDDETVLHIGFSTITPKLDDNAFKIVGDNLKTVRERGIDRIIDAGKTISFVTAPKYFGDGYVMPMVALRIDGNELLTFEEGYRNLMAWLK